jgi:hypothetical protein
MAQWKQEDTDNRFLCEQLEGAIEKTQRDASLPEDVKLSVVAQLQRQLDITGAELRSGSDSKTRNTAAVERIRTEVRGDGGGVYGKAVSPQRSALSSDLPPPPPPPPPQQQTQSMPRSSHATQVTQPIRTAPADLDRFCAELQDVNKRLCGEVATKRAEVTRLTRRNRELEQRALQFSVKDRQRGRELDAHATLLGEASRREKHTTRRVEASETRLNLYRQQLAAASEQIKGLKAKADELERARLEGISVLAEHNSLLNENDTAIKALVESRNVAARAAVEQEQSALGLSARLIAESERCALLEAYLDEARKTAERAEHRASAMKRDTHATVDAQRFEIVRLQAELGAAKESLKRMMGKRVPK